MHPATLSCVIGDRKQSRQYALEASSCVAILLIATCAASDIIVSTTNGCLRGISRKVLDKPVEVFLGIPYGKPPVGNLRFRRAQAIESWDGVYDATTAKNSCMQPRVPRGFHIPTTLSEDCLYLNVWTPKASNALRLPVLVWFHGGMFRLGSAYEARYNGSALAALNDVVVVSCNFRMSSFSFIDGTHPEMTGNLALWDQLLVLQWIQSNIRVFGGDPDSVTAFGESSGAMFIHAHLLSPHSRGLIHRIFLMSGTMSSDACVDSVPENREVWNAIAASLRCSTSSTDLRTSAGEVLDCLRERSADELCAATKSTLRPTFETEFIPCRPSFAMKEGFFHVVDAMVSVTANEGAFIFLMQPDEGLFQEDLSGYKWEALEAQLWNFIRPFVKEQYFPLVANYTKSVPAGDNEALRKAIGDFLTHHHFYCPSRFFAEKLSAKGGKVFAMVFGYRSEKSMMPKWFGATHTQEIPFVFGIPYLEPTNYTDSDRAFSAYSMKTLVSFARNGKPKLHDGEEWLPFSAEHPHFMWLEEGNYTTANNFPGDTCDMWRTFV